MARHRGRNGPNDSPEASMKRTIRLLLLFQLFTILIVEIQGRNTPNDYNLRNGNPIIKTSHIQNLDSEENASEHKETMPLNEMNQMDDIRNIRLAAGGDNNDAITTRNGNVDKIGRYDKNEPTPCHMDIEYKLTKRVLGQCTNLGRSARGCIAGNYLQMFNPACF